MQVDLRDWLGRHVYAMGEYEPGTTRVVKTLLRPGDTFVDVGANIGYFSLLAASRVGARGTVYSFEPIPEIRSLLQRNAALNGFTNVVVSGSALSDSAGEATFHVGPLDHRGVSSLRVLPEQSALLRVCTERLDALLTPAAKTHLIKLDVEGAEYLALRGMDAILRRDRPDLVVEVTDSYLRGLGHSAGLLCGHLFDLGYQMYLIDHHSLEPVLDPSGPWPFQFNALFTARPELPAGLRTGRDPAIPPTAGANC